MNKLLIPVICLWCISCSQQAEPAAYAPPSATTPDVVQLTDIQLRNAGIETGTPIMRKMSSKIKVSGLVEVPPQNMITVSFPLGGYVKSTDLLPGMAVRKGQTIAVMQDPSFVQMEEDYLIAKAKMAFLQKEWKRQKTLNETKATSDKVYEQSVSDYESQKILVSALRQKLVLAGIQPSSLSEASIGSTVAITSPINGFVASVNVNVGKYVNPSDVLFELVDTDDLHLALTVFEKDLPGLYKGQRVEASLTSDSSRMYAAEIILIGKSLDSNRSTTVHCHFVGTTPALLPGTFLNAQIELDIKNSLAVPEDAVVRSGSKEYVFVQTSTRQFKLTEVETGSSHDGFTAIGTTSNNLLQKTIITKNAYAALMQLKNTGEEEE